MPTCATEGTTLTALVRIVIPLCRRAERSCPRTGPGRKPEIPDWVLGALVALAILCLRKTKGAQYAFWDQRRPTFARLFPGQRLPSRYSFYARYARLGRVLAEAVRLAGDGAIARGWADPNCVAVDKSMIAARGQPWDVRDRAAGRRRRGVDPQAGWGRSTHDGWVYGYSFEVVVTAEERGASWPLLASADAADRTERRSFAEKVPHLPTSTRWILADRGYDSNALAEAVEWRGPRRRSGRRLLCPEVRRANVGRPRASTKESARRRHSRRLRDGWRLLLASPRGRRLYVRRGRSVEPFNERLKSLFELHDRVWHRGLGNNRTQLLGAILGYQVLLTYNRRRGRADARVKWVLSRL